MRHPLRTALSGARAEARLDAAPGVVPGIAARIYRLLVWLYPPAFRRQFAFEMACDFDEATSDAWREGRWLAVVPLWMRLGHDLTWTVVIQWLRHGLPVVAVVPALATTMAVLAGASAIWRSLQPRALLTGDAGLRLLLFFATMVVLIAAAVITFTVAFWLLVVRRHNDRARRRV